MLEREFQVRVLTLNQFKYRHTVGVSLQSTCPYCNASVPYASNPCGFCGATLEWAALPDGTELTAPDKKVWTLERVLGRGGFGITYLARSGTDRVAIKECFPDGLVTRNPSSQVQTKAGCELEFARLKKRFIQETRILKRLKHPVSTQFLASWETAGTAYLMMEFLEGETLEARIAGGVRLSEAEAVRVLDSVLDLLEVVHDKDLLHRDIKPANVILTAAGVELIDFGSTVKFDPKKTMRVTSRLLTPAYAPLELYGANVRLGPSSDLYSLAATVYEAMTGLRVPSALDRANGAIVQPLEAVSRNCSRDFSKVIARALELRVDDRFSSARRMRTALGKTGQASSAVMPSVQVAPTRKPTVTPATKIPSSSGRTVFRGVIFSISAVVVVFMLVFMWFLFDRQTKKSEEVVDLKEEFVGQQCAILKEASLSLGCEASGGGGDDAMLGMYLYPTKNRRPLPLETFQDFRNDPEFVDFTQEVGMEAIKKFGVTGVRFRVIHNQKSGDQEFTFEVNRASYDAQILAEQKRYAAFQQDLKDGRLRISSERALLLRRARQARASIRSTIQASRGKFERVMELEFAASKPLPKRGMKVRQIFWNDNGARISLFISLPGDEDWVRASANDRDLRLEIKALMLNFYKFLPTLDYFAVFISEDKENSGGEWSVSLNRSELPDLKKAQNAQLDEVWMFSSDEPVPVNTSDDLSVDAWIIPVNTFILGANGTQWQRLGFVQARSKYGWQGSGLYPPSSYSGRVLVGGSLFPLRGQPFGAAQVLSICCDIRDDADLKMQIDFPSSHALAGTYPVSSRIPLRSERKPPPKELRLRLKPGRDGVVFEWDWRSSEFTYLLEVQSEGGSTMVVVPVKDFDADSVKFIMPFKVFGARNTVRLTALNFTDSTLSQIDIWGKPRPANASDLQATRLEVGPITREALIALNAKEQMVFTVGKIGVVLKSR